MRNSKSIITARQYCRSWYSAHGHNQADHQRQHIQHEEDGLRLVFFLFFKIFRFGKELILCLCCRCGAARIQQHVL